VNTIPRRHTLHVTRISVFVCLIAIVGALAQEKRDPRVETKDGAKPDDRVVDKANNNKVLIGRIEKVTPTEITLSRDGQNTTLKRDRYAIDFWDGVTNAPQLLAAANDLRLQIESKIDEASSENEKPDTFKLLSANSQKARKYLERIRDESDSREEFKKAATMIEAKGYEVDELRKKVQEAIQTRDTALDNARGVCTIWAASAKLKDFVEAKKEADEASVRLGKLIHDEKDKIAELALTEVQASLTKVCKSLAVLSAGNRESDLSRLDPVSLATALGQMENDRLAIKDIIAQKILGKPIIGSFETYLTQLNSEYMFGKSNSEASTALAALILKGNKACDALVMTPPSKYELGEKSFAEYITELQTILKSYRDAFEKMKTANHAYAFEQAKKYEVKFAQDRREAIVKFDLILMERTIADGKNAATPETTQLRISDLNLRRKRLLGYPSAELPEALRDQLAKGLVSLVVALSDTHAIEGGLRLKNLLLVQQKLQPRFAGLNETNASETVASLIREAEKPSTEFGRLATDLAEVLKTAGGKHKALEKLISEVQLPNQEAMHTHALLQMWGPASNPDSSKTSLQLDGVDRVLAASNAALKTVPSDLPAEVEGLRARTAKMLLSREQKAFEVRHHILFAENNRALTALLGAAENRLKAGVIPASRVALVEARELIAAQNQRGKEHPPLQNGPEASQLAGHVETERSVRTQSDQLLAEVRRAANWQPLPLDGSPLVPPDHWPSRLRWDLLIRQGKFTEAEELLASLPDSTDLVRSDSRARLFFARGLAAENQENLPEALDWYHQAAEAAPGQVIAAAARSATMRLEARNRRQQDEANTQQRVFAVVAGTLMLGLLVGIPLWRHSKPGRIARARQLLLRVGSSPDPKGAFRKAADLLIGVSDDHPVVRELLVRLGQLSQAVILSDQGPTSPRVEMADADSKSVLRYSMSLPPTQESVHHCIEWLHTEGKADSGTTRGVIDWLHKQLIDCEGRDPDELRWRAIAAEKCEKMFPRKQWPLLAQVRALAGLQEYEALVRVAKRITHRGLKPIDSQAVLLHHGSALVRLERFSEAGAFLGSLQKQKRLPAGGERWLSIARAAVIAKSSKQTASVELIERLVSDRPSEHSIAKV